MKETMQRRIHCIRNAPLKEAEDLGFAVMCELSSRSLLRYSINFLEIKTEFKLFALNSASEISLMSVMY